MATAREILANMFEHTINSFNAINMFPRKQRGPDKGAIEWPSFYAESLYTPILNQEGELVDRKFSTQKFLKKTGIFLAGLTLSGLIIAGLVFTGGTPAIGLMVLYGLGAIAGAIALPGIYFTAKVALRSVAKLAWTVVAGPISDVLDGVFRKLPKAIYGGIKNRVKTIQGSKRFHSVEDRSDIKFRVSKDEKGQQVYTTSVNLDTLPESQQELALRALVRSAAVFHKENNEEGAFKIEVLYKDEPIGEKNQERDARIIKAELAQIKSSAGQQASPATFKVKKDSEGKRVYTPAKEWGSLNSTTKEQVVRDILAFETREKSQDAQADSRPRSIINIGTKNTDATRELSEIVTRLKGAPQEANPSAPGPEPIDPILHQSMGPPPQTAAQDPARVRPPPPPSPTNPAVLAQKRAQLERDKVPPPAARGPHVRRPGS